MPSQLVSNLAKDFSGAKSLPVMLPALTPKVARS
jgi:hypothetical protein